MANFPVLGESISHVLYPPTSIYSSIGSTYSFKKIILKDYYGEIERKIANPLHLQLFPEIELHILVKLDQPL